MAIVYVHKNPITKNIFYVGIGSREDRSTFFRNRNKRWQSYVSKYGTPIVEIIARCETIEQACEIEIRMIQELGRRGIDFDGSLVNLCSGGRYRNGFVHSAESKEKISAAGIGRKVSDSHRMRMITANPAKSESARRKISASKTGRVVSEETRRKLSENSSARRPDVAMKISSALKGRRGALNGNSISVHQMSGGKIVDTFESIMLAADSTNSDFRLISAVCKGKRKKHNGYEWRYA
jgi:hypothetical protein